MLPSSPVEKLKNGKKSKKKYQKFDIHQEGEKIGTFEKSENKIVAWGKQNVGKTSSGFFDFKDFPELIATRMHYKNSQENSSSKFKEDGSQVPVINVNEEKSDKRFPVLPFNTKYETNKMNLIQKKKHSSGSDLGRNNFEIRLGVEAKVDVNMSKKSQAVVLNKNSVQHQKSFRKKKGTDPVCLNFQDILDINKKKKKRKDQYKFKTKVQRFRSKELLSGNLLDSSNPKRSCGKHREIKKRKLTSFKKSIIKERILKQKMKEMANGSTLQSECFNLIQMIDFKKEIKNYLDELNKRKTENSACNMDKVKDNVKLKNNVKNEGKIEGKIEINCNKREEENSTKVSNLKKKEMPVITSDGEVQYSSKFREYCDNMITPSLNAAMTELIRELIKYQDKLFWRDPIRARIHKRHVSGIKEVKKYLTLKKVKMVIIAPDLEKMQMEGGIYDAVNELKTIANRQNVPYGFTLNRYKLGVCARKNTAVSAFAVLNYEGLETFYKNALHELEEAKKNFAELTKPTNIPEEAEETEDVNSQIISTLMSAFRENVQISGKTELD